MVSFEGRETPNIIAGILIFAALASPHAGSAQSATEPVTDDQQAHVIDQIETAEAEDGIRSTDLIDPLRTLAFIYEENGDHDLAAATIERALQIVRVNYGLHSLEQVPLMQQSIHNQETRGNLAAAWQLGQELVVLARRNPDDLRTVPIFRDVADAEMALVKQYLVGEVPSYVDLDAFLVPDTGSRALGARLILIEARRNYQDAIAVLRKHELYASAELRELEMQLVRTAYVYGYSRKAEVALYGDPRPARVNQDAGPYLHGRRSLRRLVEYELSSSASWFDRIEAAVQVGDWDLLFSRNGMALDVYEQSYDELKRNDIDQKSIDEIFAPQVPIVLPAFMPNPLETKETPQSTGFIDVTFEISKYGRSRRIEVLDTTTNATNDDKQRLVRLITASRFRPQVTEGGFANNSPVVVRYYLNGRTEGSLAQ